MKHRPAFRDDTDMNIRVSWSINCAVQEISANPLGGWDEAEIKKKAEKYLDVFEDMKHEVNICASCLGLASNKEAVINGMHPNCRRSESYKDKN